MLYTVNKDSLSANSVSVTWIGAIPITVMKAQPQPSRSSWAVGICISMVTGSVKRNSPGQSRHLSGQQCGEGKKKVRPWFSINSGDQKSISSGQTPDTPCSERVKRYPDSSTNNQKSLAHSDVQGVSIYPSLPGTVPTYACFPVSYPFSLERVLVQTVNYMVTLAFQEIYDFFQQPLGRKTIWPLKVIELPYFCSFSQASSHSHHPTAGTGCGEQPPHLCLCFYSGLALMTKLCPARSKNAGV